MNIGGAPELGGLPVKTIRHYEDVGLIRPDRSPSGYRQFDEMELHKPRFAGRARLSGFGLEACRELLSLHQDSAMPDPRGTGGYVGTSSGWRRCRSRKRERCMMDFRRDKR